MVADHVRRVCDGGPMYRRPSDRCFCFPAGSSSEPVPALPTKPNAQVGSLEKSAKGRSLDKARIEHCSGHSSLSPIWLHHPAGQHGAILHAMVANSSQTVFTEVRSGPRIAQNTCSLASDCRQYVFDRSLISSQGSKQPQLLKPKR